ncbi:hypothetical protein IJD44_06380 [bacterium]|nr:hypothetical protein [bacterium]
MVDNRSAGVLGIGGGINFKSGDISGTAAKTSDDRASQGTEYFLQEGEEQQQNNNGFVDRSMQLRASLNSLALLNVVSVLRNKKKSILFEERKRKPSTKVKRVEKLSNLLEENREDN